MFSFLNDDWLLSHEMEHVNYSQHHNIESKVSTFLVSATVTKRESDKNACMCLSHYQLPHS